MTALPFFWLNLLNSTKGKAEKQFSFKGGICGLQEYRMLAAKAACEGNLAGRESPDYPLESPRFRLFGKSLEDKFSCPVMGQKNCHGFGLRSVVKLLANIWPGKARFLLCDDHELSPKLAGEKTTSDFLSRRQSE